MDCFPNESMSTLEEYMSTYHIYLQEPNLAPSETSTAQAEIEEAAYDSSEEEESKALSKKRRVWMKTRSKEWWKGINDPSCPDSDFSRHFKMSKSTFDQICEWLGTSIAKEDTSLRTAIPVRERIAVCLWRLATGEPLRQVSKRFGLGISTCHKLIIEVCSAIRNVLTSKFLAWPDAAESVEISRRFEVAFGISNVIGAMYTTHVPITAPKANTAAYFNEQHTARNKKPSYSVTMQGVVDSNGIFTDICIGLPGSLSDAEALKNSGVFKRGRDGALTGSWIVGGDSYPLTNWMLVPYTNQSLTWTQHALNVRVSQVREVARKAFEKMMRRWGCLQKRMEMKLDDLPLVLEACCVLHNICELRGDELVDTGTDGAGFQLMDGAMVAENGIWSIAAMEARDRIAYCLVLLFD